MPDGAKDKRIAAATNDDDGSKPNKIPRKDEQIAAAAAPTDYDFPYKPALIECLQRARDKYNWDPELLKTSADDVKQLPYEQQRRWVLAHFLVRKHASWFKDEYLREFDEEEDSLFY